ncbi:YDG domain-containing protein [Caulobacter endophyticus]|uniref:Filamentous haemagglutinin FhaB/tRNA nuclease CdiA-like TPS domain-containing protein n=1 Tax=Caulobacter endophyticus TaxID=2172652 RepID=A0A2T9JEN1_9CAUL|nr:YDG domain-containing protein [Caulobacter endophyticus]PVM82162.1 hypothetical protein DDF67_24470 [Caulobacter endophyticus]
MTQSSPLLRTASRSQGRAKLLAASALCGWATMLAQPALAGTLPSIPGAGSITVSTGGSQPVISYPDPVTLQVQLNASRTVINWSSLHVSSGDTMEFQFNAASDIVLNKTTSQIAIDNGGTVIGKVGAAAGGNVWFYSPQGVIVSPGATMSAGGFVFAGGAGLIDANFVDAADPTSVLRAASNAMIRMTTVTSATSASINTAGDVVLSASSGALNAQTVYGATAQVSTTSGSITASEVTATSGAASVTAGGPGATVTQIIGATGVTVSSANNSSVGSATTTVSGDILITSNGSASLTLGNSARDITLSAPQVFMSTVDAVRSVYVTGTTQAYVTNRIFAGDDVEITADGNVTAGGAYIKTTGTGADDSHILIRSTNGFASGGTLLTQGTGSKAGDITVSGATSTTLTTGVSSRDLKMSGESVSVNNATAARDIALTASNGSVTITTSVTAGDDVEVVATGGDVLASGVTLKSTGADAADDGHVTARSTTGAVNIGSAITQGSGAAAGDVWISGSTGSTLGSASSTKHLIWTGGDSLALTGNYSASGQVTLVSGGGALNQTAGVVTANSLSASGATGIDLSGDNQIDRAISVQATANDVVLNNAKALIITGNIGARDITVTTTAGDLTANSATQIVATRNLILTGATGVSANTGIGGLFSGATSVTVTATTGDASVATASSNGTILVRALDGSAALRKAAITGTGSLSVVATGAATLGADSLAGNGSGNTVSRTGGVGAINVTSTGGDARVFLDSLNATLTQVTASNASGTASIGVDGGFSAGTVGGYNVWLDASNGTANATSITLGGGDYTARARNWGGATLNPGGTIRNLSITDTDGGLVLANALAATGDLTLESFDALSSAYDLTADGDVTVTAAGDIDLRSATAGDDIKVNSTGGQAILRKADLTGAGVGRDLSVTAATNAVLGDTDYTAITASNLFTRSGGGAGVAEIKSAGGSAMVHLDASAAIDTVTGTDVDVTIANGAATFDAITATAGDLYAEAYDGAFSIGTATAVNGDVTIVNAGGDLTITGSVHGGNQVDIQTDGRLDATLAGLISSDGDLSLVGGSVEAGHLTADGMIEATAMDTDVTVQLAEAGQSVVVASLNGDATLRAAKAPDAVALIAFNKATFGADDKASITAANYVDTDPSCGCGFDGLQVLSYNGDAVVNIDSATNGIGAVSSSGAGSVTIVQKTGDLKIGGAAGYNVTLEAMNGTLEIAQAGSYGGDYSITAQGFLGAALTPDLVAGAIRDVTIIDTLGDLDLGAAAIHADRKLTIAAQGGAVTGQGQLSAGAGLGDGDISLSGQGVSIASAEGDGNLTLNGGTGVVNVATSVSVGGDYSLTGGAFTGATLAPLGAKAGAWTIVDNTGDFDFTGASLRYGGDISITAAGALAGGAVTSDNGDILVTAVSGQLGAVDASSGQVSATATTGGMTLASARAADSIEVAAAAGTASLGSAVLTGTGSNSLLVRSTGGDVVLGAATPGAITTANLVTSAGASTTVEASTAAGKVDVNLDRTDTALTTIAGRDAVKIAVLNGPQRIVSVSSTSSSVQVDGPTGVLTIDQLTANATSQVNGGGDTRLVSATIVGDLSVKSATGALRFGDATPGRVIAASGALSLDAAADIAQQGVLQADTLSVAAGTGVVLLGANQVAHLDAVSVAGGGFAFNDTIGFDIRGPITAAGQAVDLRSAGAIAQDAAGVITAQRLTGASAGGADFGAANQVVQLGDFTNTGGLFRLIDNRSLTIDGTVHSTGTVSLASHGGMAITANGKVVADGAGDAVILASDGVFTNARGADAVSATNSAGRWLIYTQAFGAPTGFTAGNDFNGLAGKSFYGSAYNFSTEAFAVAPNAGNRFVYAYQPILAVNPVSLVVTYNGAIPTVSATVSGLVNGDAAADAWSGAPTVSGATSKNAGTYALTAGGGLTSDMNYGFSYGSGTLRIDPKTIGGLLAADSKTYDRSTSATGAITLSGVVAGDSVSAAGTYAFTDRNAGSGKAVTASGVVLSGGDAGNYVLSPVANAQADIFRKALTGAFAANDKTYDGTSTASGSIGVIGVIAGDAVTASGTYAFADRNAGQGKMVTVSSAILAGADAANYDLGSVGGDLADILRRQVSVSADNQFKPFGQVDPTLTYHINLGSLVAGESFTGVLGRGAGEAPGSYAINRGSLALSSNYDLTFTGAVFTIERLPTIEQEGSVMMKYVTQSPDFTLDWNPEANLQTEGPACEGEGCPSQAVTTDKGQTLAALP